jgi:Cu/Ag efflux pump CusA
MDHIGVWISGIGLVLAITGSLASLFYKMGQHSARLDKLQVDSIKLSLVESHAIRIQTLEEWRTNVRRDMHEISEKMTEVVREIHGVKTLIEERTERRKFERPYQSNWQENDKK